jgi:hypothetical protein
MPLSLRDFGQLPLDSRQFYSMIASPRQLGNRPAGTWDPAWQGAEKVAIWNKRLRNGLDARILITINQWLTNVL